MKNDSIHKLLICAAVFATGCVSTNSGRDNSNGIFASALRQQVGTDVLQCPYGADPSGECNSMNNWVDARSWGVLPVAPPPNATDELIAKYGMSQFIFQKVQLVGQDKFRLVSRCSTTLPDQAPIVPTYASLTVYDRLRSKVSEKIKGEIASKVKTEAQLSRLVGEFESRFNSAIATQLAAGSESNALLVEGRLMDDPRKIPSAVRKECLGEGVRVVTGVSGFIVLKSTSASEVGLASSIGAAFSAAVTAVTDLPEAEKVALINASATFSTNVASEVIRQSGFTMTVTQKKFFPVWGEVREVSCQDQVYKAKSTTLSVSLSSTQKNDGVWKLEGSCSSGATMTEIEDGVTCTLLNSGDLEAKIKSCSLKEIIAKK